LYIAAISPSDGNLKNLKAVSVFVIPVQPTKHTNQVNNFRRRTNEKKAILLLGGTQLLTLRLSRIRLPAQFLNVLTASLDCMFHQPIYRLRIMSSYPSNPIPTLPKTLLRFVPFAFVAVSPFSLILCHPKMSCRNIPN